MRILEIRPEQCIIEEDDGNVSSRPTGDYYKMRLFSYNNGRIHYIFGEDSYIFETFDQRIFNAMHNGMRLQLRQDLSDRIIAAIRYHQNTGNSSHFEDLFEYATKEIPFRNILEAYLKNIDCLKKVDQGYIVHDEFLIDNKGNAWIRREEPRDGLTDEYYKKNPLQREWQSLCIVMQGHSSMANDSWIPDETGAIVRVNSLTMTIITKVMFLVAPNLQDQVFTNQLPMALRIKLKKVGGGEKVE